MVFADFCSLSIFIFTEMADKAAARARFEGVFDTIAEELLAYLKQEGMPAEAIQWYKDVSSTLASNARRGGGGDVVGAVGDGWASRREQRREQ